jgi:GTPase SAR1 family protein
MKARELRTLLARARDEGARSLDLSGQDIHRLPAGIGELTELGYLNLSDNELSALPPEIGRLRKLKVLNLSNNRLRALPASLGELRELRYLSASSNRIEALPESLGALERLVELHLDGNQLNDLPAGFAELQSLVILNMGFNPLGHLPSEVCQLSELRSLEVRYLGLAELPPEIARLNRLDVLNLGGNELRTLPPEIACLERLEFLFVDLNDLEELPAELSRLKRLRKVALDDNDNLKSPPPEVVARGIDSVLWFLREVALRGTERARAKLLLLGDGNEGKTCLSRALRGLEFQHQPNTRGVEIHAWQHEVDGVDGSLTLDIWDFEGQEINHQSHQFFLTERSLYVVVFNGRRDVRMDRLEYWLDTIRARAPGCRALLVATECEDRNPTFPLDRLKARYPDLLSDRCYFAVGAENRRNIDALSLRLGQLATELEQVPMRWPQSYALAEGSLKELAPTEAHIPRSELYEIFDEAGIEPAQHEAVSRVFGDLGILTHFPDCPELWDFVVLRPQWLTRAISHALEHEELARDFGEMDLHWLRELWEGEYPGMFGAFYACMKEFELCYPLEHLPNLCLVPLRFSYARPDIPWAEIESASERRIEYHFDASPPAGLISRFIVKIHHLIVKSDVRPKGVYWRNGVFVEAGTGPLRAQALCELEGERRVFRIRVRAQYAQNLIERLDGFARAVFRFYRGFKPVRYYGCVLEDEGPCPGLHEERRVAFALSRGKALDCAVSWHELNPVHLVHGLHSFAQERSIRDLLRDENERLLQEAALNFGLDSEAIVARLDLLGEQLSGLQEGGLGLNGAMAQRFQQSHRELLNLMDQRERGRTPSLFTVVPVEAKLLDPARLFHQAYRLRFYCEEEGSPHPGDSTWEFVRPRAWWATTAPMLTLGLKLFRLVALPGLAALPLGIDPEAFKVMKDEVALMTTLVKVLPVPKKTDDDDSELPEEGVQIEAGTVTGTRRFGLAHATANDRARAEFNALMAEIDAASYAAHVWGDLRRVLLPDNSYRFLCPEHAEPYLR